MMLWPHPYFLISHSMFGKIDFGDSIFVDSAFYYIELNILFLKIMIS